MRIAIIAAMKKEIDLLLQQLPDPKVSELEDLTLYEGCTGEHEFIVAQCGIGKVNSALRTSRLLETFKPDLVINTGVAAGVDASMRIGDVLVADRVAYHDVWCGPGTDYGQADGCPKYFQPSLDGLRLMRVIADDPDIRYKFGLLCSGDKFICKPAEVEEIKRNFTDALGCDMESASIAQTCLKAGVPFMIVRVMSDMPGGGENIEEYANFWDEAPSRTFEALSKLIEML